MVSPEKELERKLTTGMCRKDRLGAVISLGVTYDGKFRSDESETNHQSPVLCSQL